MTELLGFIVDAEQLFTVCYNFVKMKLKVLVGWLKLIDVLYKFQTLFLRPYVKVSVVTVFIVVM